LRISHLDRRFIGQQQQQQQQLIHSKDELPMASVTVAYKPDPALYAAMQRRIQKNAVVVNPKSVQYQQPTLVDPTPAVDSPEVMRALIASGLSGLVHIGEADPNGLDAHAPGAKLDAGKPRPALVLNGFARALREVVNVGTYGAKKYTDNGWMEVPNGIERYSDALHRHLLSEATGEACDADTDLLHAAHAAWNALARLDLMIRESEKSV
jgi:hypothetical protein